VGIEPHVGIEVHMGIESHYEHADRALVSKNRYKLGHIPLKEW